MSNRVGICPVCKRRVRLMTLESRRAVAWHEHPVTADGRWGGACDGWRGDPIQTPGQIRRTRNRAALHTALLAPFRIEAAVALDAWIERHAYPEDDLDVLLRVALFHYQLHYPDSRAANSVRYVARLDRQHRGTSMGDVYCTFCGVLVYRKFRGGVDPKVRVKQLNRDRHAVECALFHLAHDRRPADPTVRKLPEEFVREEELSA